jgi:nucleoid DNA-binding protein
VKKRAGRVGRNPRTGAEIRIAPTKTVGFKPSAELKSSL